MNDNKSKEKEFLEQYLSGNESEQIEVSYIRNINTRRLKKLLDNNLFNHGNFICSYFRLRKEVISL